MFLELCMALGTGNQNGPFPLRNTDLLSASGTLEYFFGVIFVMGMTGRFMSFAGQTGQDAVFP